MEIKIWADFACPFCYIGETQLEKVINDLGKQDDITLRFMAYQLDPKAPEVPVESMIEHFMAEHKETEEEARAQIEHITKMAARAGLDYNLIDVKVCSTMDAHRLMKYAQANASQATVVKLNFALYRANFVENLRLSDRHTLADIAERCGLDRKAVEVMLESFDYVEQVKNEVTELNERPNFDYIPYMEFDDGTVLQGVISPGALKKAL